jgi:hypothetical protein
VNIRDDSFGIKDASKNFPSSVNQKLMSMLRGKKTEIKGVPQPNVPISGTGTIPGPINSFMNYAVYWVYNTVERYQGQDCSPSEGTV